MAIVKYNNQSISAIDDVSGIDGSMVLIKTLTASSDSTLSFVDGSSDVVLDNTYPIYKFVWINAHPSTTGSADEFQFNFSTDTGSNYNVSKTSTYFVATHAEDDTSTSLVYSTSHDHANGTGFQNISVDMDADNDASSSGELFIFSPSSTTFVKHFMAQSNYMHSSPLSINSFVGGYCNTTSAVDAVRFQFSGSATIESGTIKLYGIKDS
tara:strand:- start:9 stop:638 length:630 start_codon:yes stop_codon:yes gene_type:complete